MEDLKQLFSELIRFETELWNAIDARLRTEHDLPLHKFEPMQIIAGRPNCRVYDIAGALSLSTGGVSKLVDSIQASGYCERRPNPDDRRSSIIELTPAGRRALARATKTFERELELRLRSCVPARTLAQFSSSLRALRAACALDEIRVDALGENHDEALRAARRPPGRVACTLAPCRCRNGPASMTSSRSSAMSSARTSRRSGS